MRYSPDGSLIAVGDRGTNHVIVLDAVTHAVVADVPVGPGPEDLAFTPNGALLLVANAGSETTVGNTVTAISIPGFAVAATILVGNGPSRIGIQPGGGFAYVLNRLETVAANRVSVIDLSTLSVATTLTVGAAPHGIAFSTDGTRAIVTSVYPGGIHVIDTATQAVMASLATLPAPAGVVFRPGTHAAVVANADHGPDCALVDADLLTAVRGQGPLAARSFMVMHPDGSRLYALSSERESLAVLNPVDGGTLGWGLLWADGEGDIAPDMGYQVLDVATPALGPASIIMADPGHSLLRWDTSTDELVGSLDVGGFVKALDASPDGLRVVVSVGDSVVITEVGLITPLGGPIEYPGPPPRQEVPCPAVYIYPDACNYNVLVLEDDGLNNAATSLVRDSGNVIAGERIYWGDTGNAVKRFYEIMPDIFDYVVVFYSTDFRDSQDPNAGLPINVQLPGLPNAVHSWVRNFTRGIGFELGPVRRFGNRSGALPVPLTTRRLQSLVNMNDLAEYDDDFMAFGGRSGVSIFAQELGHRFVAFAEVVGGNRLLLRRDLAHWSPVFNSFGSAVGSIWGNLINETPPGSGTFQIDAQEITYGSWDEYLMGFVPATSVPASFVIGNPNPPPPPLLNGRYPIGQIITGTRRPFAIDGNMIAIEGARRPNDNLSQRVFHVGACLVIPKNDPACVTDVMKAHAFAEAMADFWKTETEGRAFLTTRMCPTIFTHFETSIAVSDYPVDAAILPNGKKLYVAEKRHEARAVAVIDTDPTSPTFHTVLSNLVLPEGDASAIDVSADGSRIYVTTPAAVNALCVASSLKIIDTGPDTVIHTLHTPCLPVPATGAQAIAVARAGVPVGLNRAYVLMTQPPMIEVFNLNMPVPLALAPIVLANVPSAVTPDIEITTDGIATVFTQPGPHLVTARNNTSGAMIDIDTGGLVPSGVAIVQLESNADNTLDRATVPPTVVAPASLVYVTMETGETRVFDLMTDPVQGILWFQPMSDPPAPPPGPFRPDILGTGLPGAVEVEFSRQGNLAVVGDMANDKVRLVNTATHSELETMTLDPPVPPGSGADPAAFVFSPDGQRLYVMSKRARRVDVFR